MSMKKMLAVVAASACVAFAAPAFAANPFSDVPMHHWAYDAVDVLAAHGVIQGYPDGTFKGNKPITRYEMSMIIARAMSAGALSGEDNALLKRLIVEFKDELDSLGVRVDGLEGRVNALEGGLEGWKISGKLGLKATFGKVGSSERTKGFAFNDWKINLDRNLSEKVKFHAEIAPTKKLNLTYTEEVKDEKEPEKTKKVEKTFDYKVNSDLSVIGFKQFYVTVSDFYFGTKLTAGKFYHSFEDEAGLTEGMGALVFDDNTLGVRVSKDFGAGSLTLLAATEHVAIDNVKSSDFVYGARFAANPSERFGLGLNAWLNKADSTNTYWIDGSFAVVDGVKLGGAYYYQSQKVAGKTDHAYAWRAKVSVDAEKLGGFTSLTAEYLKAEKGFKASFGDDVKEGVLAQFDVSGFYFGGEQGWNDRLTSYFDFTRLTAKKANKGKNVSATSWDIGVKYNYNPYLQFGLEYANTSYTDKFADDESTITFKTTFKF